MRFLAAILLFVTGVACAQSVPTTAVAIASKSELFAGYTYQRTDTTSPFTNANGGTAAYSYFFTSRVAATVQGSLVKGPSQFHDYAITFGPRLDLTGGHIRPFVQFLGGYMDEQMYALHAGSFGFQAGGGVNLVGTRHIGWRIVQLEYEYQNTAVATSNSNGRLRISTGLNLRF